VTRVIDRASDADLAYLAMDRGPVPEQLAVVLLLDRPLTAAACGRLLAERVRTVPRLRQRLVRTPPGCGPPIWADDEQFDVRRHLEVVAGPVPDDVLPDLVMPWVLRRLPRDRPLWRAVLAGEGSVLVLVVHHAVSDGLGGLAVLGRLLDGADPVPPAPFSRRVGAGRLALDAWRARAGALRSLPARRQRLRTAMTAAGGVSAGRVPPCSLLRPTGARRRAVVVRVGLPALREAAHRHGAGVHAALLTAVAGALRRLLAGRGETLDAVTIAVPVGTGRPAGRSAGNDVSPLVVAVPATGPPGHRLALVADEVRRRRPVAAGPAPITVLGGWFRLFAALGGYRWYMTHQRRLHTLVSLLRGPVTPVRLGGAAVREMIPVVVGGATDITVSFVALSYLDTLAVTVVADPDRCPDLDHLGDSLAAELEAIAG
jgi:diacylglycerol O-acyltransferase / wax synthase